MTGCTIADLLDLADQPPELTRYLGAARAGAERPETHATGLSRALLRD